LISSAEKGRKRKGVIFWSRGKGGGKKKRKLFPSFPPPPKGKERKEAEVHPKKGVSLSSYLPRGSLSLTKRGEDAGYKSRIRWVP